jgi:hypothetical protein
MKNSFLILVAATVLTFTENTFGQSKSQDQQYAFIMVMNREATKLHFSPIFSFLVDKRGNPADSIADLQTTYRKGARTKNLI